MQSRSLAFLVFVVALTGLSIWGFNFFPYAYGLDVKGGVRLSYQIDPKSLTPEQTNRIASIQDDLVKIMETRTSAALGVVEGAVSKKGTDQIIVELPGYTKIEVAKETLGTTAKIQVYRASNVSSPIRQRIYERGEEEKVNGVPVVTFKRRLGSSEAIRPGTPAYLNMIKGWELVLEGGDVKTAYPKLEGTSTVPMFEFTASGAQKLEAMTRKWKQDNIAFVLDNKVLSIASVQPDTILSDNAYINGTFEPEYVRSLTELVKAGALPVNLLELSSQKVDPTIGNRALNDMVLAGSISFAIVVLFLIVYYGFPGLIAAMAMCLYALFTITVLKALHATFSLAAIAGFILSISMAVDANILIFERLKEEVRAGKTLLTAIELGFKRALAAIFDSNGATLSTCLVLWILGTGPVKGFATTLGLGVMISFFTAVVITRAIISGMTGIGIGTNPKWYALNRNWFGEGLEQKAETAPLPILQKSGLYFGISLGIMAIGLIFIAIGGIKPNVEFQGGFEAIYQVPMSQTLNADEIHSNLKQGGITKANIKFGEGRDAKGQPTRLAYITIPYNAGLQKGDPNVQHTIATAAKLPEEGASAQEIGPTVQKETVSNALLGTAISAGLIILMLAIRFGVALGGFKNGIKFGISAVIAMLHDIVVVIGVAGVVGFLLGWELSALFITAMLTVASFSVHDTIVIFDRIRENLRKPHKGQTFEHLVNKSITQTIARSINTSMAAIVTLIILIAVGTPTPELKFMCVAMLTGMLIGTYSSIFNASPILYLWDKAVIKSKGAAAGLMQEAEREIKLRATAAQAAQTASAGYGTVVRKKSVAERSQTNVDDE